MKGRVRCAGRNDREIVLAQEMHKNDSACVFAIERTKVFINCINLQFCGWGIGGCELRVKFLVLFSFAWQR